MNTLETSQKNDDDSFERIIGRGEILDSEKAPLFSTNQPRRIPAPPRRKLSPSTLYPEPPQKPAKITRSELESLIFNYGEINPFVKFLGELGNAYHSAVESAVAAYMGGSQSEDIKKRIDMSGGAKKFIKLSQQHLLPEENYHTNQADKEKFSEDSEKFAKNMMEIFGLPEKYERNINFHIPVSFRTRHKVSELITAPDAIVFGKNAIGIVDYKTGQRRSDENILFHLAIMAVCWTIEKNSRDGDHKSSWGGKRIDVRSHTALARLRLDTEPTFAIVGKDYVETNYTLKVTPQEFNECVTDINHWILHRMELL